MNKTVKADKTEQAGRRLLSLLGHIVLLMLGILWVYPFIWMLSTSFKNNSEIFSNPLGLIPDRFMHENYVRAWNSSNFNLYFFNTVAVTAAVVGIVLFTTSFAGYAIGRYRFAGKKLLIGLFIATSFIPQGVTLIPIFQLIKDIGLMNTRLGIILAESGAVNIMMIMMFASQYRQIPDELEESARLDGAGFFSVFSRIMFPLAKPVAASVIVVQFVFTWNSFMMPLVLTMSNSRIRTLAVGLYTMRGENAVDWTGICAGGGIALIPVIVIFIILQRYFVDGMAGAVKG